MGHIPLLEFPNDPGNTQPVHVLDGLQQHLATDSGVNDMAEFVVQVLPNMVVHTNNQYHIIHSDALVLSDTSYLL